MSILTKSEIRKKIDDGSIVITPFDYSQLNPNSYDVRLGNVLACYVDREFDCKKEHDFVITEVQIPEDGIWIRPGLLYLASTLEYTESHDTVPYLDGKSSTARAGIKIHLTAGRGDIGFCGHWTMEIEVVHPVKIYAGMKVGQLTWHTVEGEIETTYQQTGQYNNRNNVPMGSGIWKQFREGEIK